MKRSTKRLLSLLMALAMILSLLPVMAFAATPETLYLKPNSNWVKDDARFAAYFFGNGEKWVSMTDSDGDGVYEVAVPSGYPSVIFCRMNGSSTANNWNNKWNQTGDLTIPTNGNNCFTVPSGSWDGSTTGWGTFNPVVAPEWESPVVDGDSVTFNYWSSDALSSVCVCGTINNWTIGANEMTKNTETGIWSVTVSGLYNGQYEYKFVTNGSNWINDPKNTGTQIGGNNTFTITDGLVDINEPEYSSPVIEGSSVTFNYWRAEEFTSATVYGDMSDDGWATAYPMVKNEETGVWSVTVSDLYNGTYEYKIVVDDAWLADPKNENVADSGNSYFQITEGEDKPVVMRPVTLYFQDNLNWNGVFTHIWNAESATTVWPGSKMTTDDGYYGWYYQYLEVPTDTISLIFNNGTGGDGYQTSDLVIENIPEEGGQYWYVPTSTDTWYEGSFVTKAPDSYMKQDHAGCTVTLHFKNTLGWHSVNGYGWTNFWPGTYPTNVWPGMELTEENGWYTLRYEAAYVVGDGAYAIFNTLSGYDEYNNPIYAQTADLQINCDGQESVEKWIIPTGEQTDYLSYTCDIFDEEPHLSAQVNGISYYTLEEAVANANGSMITMLWDNYTPITFNADLTIDLAGYKLYEVTVADGYTLTLIDSYNDTYEGYGCAYVKGAVNTFAEVDGKNYVAIDEGGQITVHRYDVQITHISLDPNHDALGYKAELYGDETVQKYVTDFGFHLWVDGGSVKTYSKAGTQSLTLRLKNILAANGGEMGIHAKAFVTLTVGEETCTKTCGDQTTSMKQTLQAVNAAWETAGYTDTQKAAVVALCKQYQEITSDWELDNIFAVIDIPIE